MQTDLIELIKFLFSNLYSIFFSFFFSFFFIRLNMKSTLLYFSLIEIHFCFCSQDLSQAVGFHSSHLNRESQAEKDRKRTSRNHGRKDAMCHINEDERVSGDSDRLLFAKFGHPKIQTVHWQWPSGRNSPISVHYFGSTGTPLIPTSACQTIAERPLSKTSPAKPPFGI